MYKIVTYEITRLDGHEGGSAVLIHKRVPHEEIQLTTTLQTVAIKVHLSRTYTICSLYIPHIPITKEELSHLLRQLQPPFLLLGDMNAKHITWGERTADPHGHGTVIDSMLLEQEIALLNYDTPAHYSLQHDRHTLIDLSVCSTICLMDFELTVLEDLHGSDWYPIKIELTQATTVAERPDRFNTEIVDWKLFTELITINLDAHSINNIDRLVRTVEQHIHTPATACMPMKSEVYSKPLVPWYNQEAREARQE